MVAAAGALEMTGGQRVELEGLARSHTAPAREVRQAKALLCAAAEGTAAVGRARAANQGSIMRPARASKPDGYLLGSYRIATAPEPNSSWLTSFKSTCLDSPANNVGPWPASLGCTTNSYSSINPSSVNASGSFTPPTNSPLPDSRLSCATALPRSPRTSSAFQSTRSRVLDTTYFLAASIVRAKGSIHSDIAPVRAGGRNAASIISYVTRPKRSASARLRFSTAFRCK